MDSRKQPNARVVIVTDRDELDNRSKASSAIRRGNQNVPSSGRDLMIQLGHAKPRLLCSLVHKFGKKGVDDFEKFIRELEAQPARRGRYFRLR